MKLEKLTKSFGKNKVLDSFSLDIEKNSVVCLMGPSGCGKTTLLNIIAGLEKQESGKVNIEGEKVSYLFQEPRLLPNLTVLQNTALPINDDFETAKIFLEDVGLSDCLDMYPSQLSGGQKQRTSIARAFAFPSSVILLDEPFQNLDLKLRNSLVGVFTDMWLFNRKTVLWVTHDITEACLVADRIICVSEKPMGIIGTFDIEKPRDVRDEKFTAEKFAEIYKILS